MVCKTFIPSSSLGAAFIFIAYTTPKTRVLWTFGINPKVLNVPERTWMYLKDTAKLGKF